MTGHPVVSPLRFAIVGCGSIAKTQIRAILELGEAAELIALCDSQDERAVELAAEFGLNSASFDAICADPRIDAVSICTPSGNHAELAVRALDAGKHVITEKPMDVSVEACERMLEATARNGRQLGVISQHRFDPACSVVREALDAGKLGDLVFAEARIPWYRSQEYYDSGNWRGTLEMDGGGCLMNQGIHTVDLMLWFAGPVKRVRAVMATAAHERIEVEDVITAQIEFASGAMGSLVASTAFCPGLPASLGIFGKTGLAFIEGDELHTLAVEGEAPLRGDGANAHAVQVASGGTRSATAGVDAGQKDAWKWGDAHRAQLLDFVESIRAGRPPKVDGPSGRDAVAFIKACYASAESGEWVVL
ncbi:MAG: Gfo/Idh/MocA family protein [Opitutales bacterium]